jgi:predicted GNAT family N-acyltransferase
MEKSQSAQIVIKIVKSKNDLQKAMGIRHNVFIEEQSVPPDIEMDVYDETATHVLAFFDGQAVGTARWRQTSEGTKLERFAVLKEFRGKGLGKALVRFILSKIDHTHKIYLHAQDSVISFYEKYGFSCVGERFFEAGISHTKMVYSKNMR